MTEEAETFISEGEATKFIVDLFEKFVTGLQSQVDLRIKELQDTIEILEQQMATLIVGYGEQASFVEALVAQIAFASEDSKNAFHETLNVARKNMLQVMKDASQQILGEQNQRLATTVSDMAESELSRTD
jgi:hypothetical protein